MVEREHPEPERWLVDGFNVLHVGILHGRQRGRWWGGEARAQLLKRIQGFTEPGELIVVFDGPDPDGGEEPAESPAQIVFAPSADDWIMAQVRAAKPGEPLRVITADRKLADRARHHGAQILSPRAFLSHCPEPDATLEGGEEAGSEGEAQP